MHCKTLDTTQSLRTREILRQVQQVEIQTNRLVTEVLAGTYHSVFKGQGIDFEAVREYTFSDDTRAIDWNVTAKLGKPFVKVFREERELTLLIVLDLSASGNFGSAQASKRERAAELAAVLAFSAIKNNDKVGLILFTDHIEKYVPPKKGRRHILRLLREMLFFTPTSKGTNIPNTLHTLNRLHSKKALVFVISDFIISENNGIQKTFHSLALTQKRHDLRCIIIQDPRETILPSIGLITLEDAETGELLQLNTNDETICKAYETKALAQTHELEREFRIRAIRYCNVSTDKPYIKKLKIFLEQGK